MSKFMMRQLYSLFFCLSCGSKIFGIAVLMVDAEKVFITRASKNEDCSLRQNPRALISALTPSAELFPLMSAEELDC